MQECIEKYFLQYFTKAFSVLPNKCNTSNWSIMADLNLEAAVDHGKYKKHVKNFANPSLHSTFYLLAKISNICIVYSYFEYACHYTPNTLLPEAH